MTEDTVNISIAIKVENTTYEYQKRIPITSIEEGVQTMAVSVGQEVICGVINEVDVRMAEQVPKNWVNAGTEERWLVSSLGAVRYKRRVYLDEQRKRQKPMDDLLGLQRYARMSGRVQEMGASLASSGSYRLAADQLSYMTKTAISHSTIQRMAWSVGNRIADGEEAERQRIFEEGEQHEAGKISAPVLYGESDGVWVHLQREKRRSTEVRVAILNTGRKAVGKDRFRLENKHCITAVGLTAEKWQEQIVREAHLFFNLEETHLLISGGDGNQWVRHSFDRLQVHQEFVLDRFHLQRAARRAFQDQQVARDFVTRFRQEDFERVQKDLKEQIQLSTGKRRKKLEDFYRYVHHNQDVLRDLPYRGLSQPAYLGAIEGNVDKLVVHRMKGRGCSWRIRGVRAMLALCRNANSLRCHAYRYIPLQAPGEYVRRPYRLEVKYSDTLQASMPIFQGPHKNRPWVMYLHKVIHAR